MVIVWTVTWDPNKAIDIGTWSICGGERLERFYCIYIYIYIYIAICIYIHIHTYRYVKGQQPTNQSTHQNIANRNSFGTIKSPPM